MAIWYEPKYQYLAYRRAVISWAKEIKIRRWVLVNKVGKKTVENTFCLF